MTTYTLKREQYLPVSIQEAWNFFSFAGNLSEITPPGMSFKILTRLTDKPIWSGMKIEYIVRPLLNIPLRWMTEIQEVNAPQSFRDAQKKGPYSLWEHTHTFTPVPGGVRMRDEVKYALPLGILGAVAHTLLVKKKLKDIFDFRKTNWNKYSENMWLLDLTIVLGTFLGMEAVAWLTHKYVMHGALWTLHEDHHKKNPTSFFEKNDYFFLIFALPGIACLAAGLYTPASFLLYIGIGITLYGFAYFMVHDIFIHQRFRIFRNSDNVYFRAIRRAHKMHHKHLGKEDGECFGMLFVPFKYFVEALKRSNANA